MKHIYIIIVCFFAFLLIGCGGNKQNQKEEERQIYQLDSLDENTGVQRMQPMHISQDISCKGKSYHLKIDRIPSDELPIVESEMGVFTDNRISVKITRENGTTLFSKSFTKNDFAPHLTTDYLKHSVLEGLVFDDVKTNENKVITLAASVSYPMTDLYIPFSLVISADGKMSLSKDEDMGELTPMDE